MTAPACVGPSPAAADAVWLVDGSVRLVGPSRSALTAALALVLEMAGDGSPWATARRHAGTMGVLGLYGSGTFGGISYAFVVRGGVTHWRLWPRPGRSVLAPALGSLIDGPSVEVV